LRGVEVHQAGFPKHPMRRGDDTPRVVAQWDGHVELDGVERLGAHALIGLGPHGRQVAAWPVAVHGQRPVHLNEDAMVRHAS